MVPCIARPHPVNPFHSLSSRYRITAFSSSGTPSPHTIGTRARIGAKSKSMPFTRAGTGAWGQRAGRRGTRRGEVPTVLQIHAIAPNAVHNASKTHSPIGLRSAARRTGYVAAA